MHALRKAEKCVLTLTVYANLRTFLFACFRLKSKQHYQNFRLFKFGHYVLRQMEAWKNSQPVVSNSHFGRVAL